MRGRLIAGLGLLVVLLAAAQAQAKTDRSATPGHVGVHRRDDRRAERAARRHRQARHAQHADLHRPTSARTCGARWRPSSRASSATPRRSPGCGRRSGRSSAWSASAGGQYFNWYDHRTVGSSPTWPPTGAPLDAAPLLGRQRLAGGGPARRWPAASPSCARALRAVRLDGLRFLLPARGQPDPLPLRALYRLRALLLRHDRLREPHRDLHRDRERVEIPQRHYYGAMAHLPRQLRLELDGDARGRASRAATSARACLEGALRVQRERA